MSKKKYLLGFMDRRIALIQEPRKKDAIDFMEYVKSRITNPNSQAPYVEGLVRFEQLGEWGERGYRDLTKKDLVEWNKKLEAKYPKSAYQARREIKCFYQWLYSNGEPEKGIYPDVVRWMKTARPKNNGEDKPKHLTQEQISKLIDTARSQRDRALLSVGYDSGARSGELLALRIEDVFFDEYGAKLRLSGKTGTRNVRIYNSVPDLQLWLNQHPKKDNSELPLWPADLNDWGAPLTKGGFDSLFYRAIDRAKLPRWVHPHTLRHSRATHLAGKLTEPQMRKFFGWRDDSKMPGLYVHLSGRDVDNAVLEAHGIKVKGKEEAEDALKPRRCIRGHDNPSGSKWCNTCGVPLDEKTLLEMERAKNGIGEIQESGFREGLLSPEKIKELLTKDDVKAMLKEVLSEEFREEARRMIKERKIAL